MCGVSFSFCFDQLPYSAAQAVEPSKGKGKGKGDSKPDDAQKNLVTSV
jgi:hypothetical protein